MSAALAALALLVSAGTSLGTVPPSVPLNNGVQMPLLSYGANLYPVETCKQATAYAIQAGFRFIWSSEIIGEPCQRAQREAIDASGVPRAEIFLAGTVDTQDCTGLDDCYQRTKAAAEKQFAVLSSSKLDMLMLDYPSSFGCEGIKGQWKAFEEVYAAKRVRTIAVSNFDLGQLKCVTSTPGATVPSVNQLRYNVGHGQRTIVAENKQLGVVVQAYSPLGAGGVLGDPLLARIGAAHGKSPAQVALKWLVQQGVGANLASTSLQHLQEDTEIFDFELSADEMAQLNAKVQPDAAGLMSKVEAPAARADAAAAPAVWRPAGSSALLALLALLAVAAAAPAAARLRTPWPAATGAEGLLQQTAESEC